ncbi:sugar ABC transporter ATP-binding protein [Alicyclobacillus dauci]|uniref:Sugar ABC transporter ATP-binding protein n=1 Tax=Alicyclobacillus dauci TaxID=1475485 RepID=A0ABY6Z976_9BACL|nr:sugar ABC transporter ATP-binding protein [Alicyclobacillus dauci]WAH39280.1 sugar ABC transporter ATP-binding protein [Alicyclobacillus dauci]WAH39466.1 sugar ABC transporter ATP-binding protein [Alicyclobacillus dauci]
MKPVLEAHHITKEFSGNVVLKDINLVCKPGSVLALCGENGAGKSTLMNIISGVLSPSSGDLFWLGENVKFRNPDDAMQRGIYIVHQELSLLPHLTIAENIFLGYEPKGKLGFLNNRRTVELAKEILTDISFDLDVQLVVSSLSPAQQQMIEIAKAWSRKPKLLILDEPTSSLPKSEVTLLIKMINTLRERGVSIIFISHRLDEILDISDRVVVLKDGVLVTEKPTIELNRDHLVQLMVGRDITQTFPPRVHITGQEESMLELKNVSVPGKVHSASLSVPKGHIVGLGGLEGQGQRDLARAIFGVNPFSNGTMVVEGKVVRVKSPRQALRCGVVYIPDNRRQEGIVPPLSVRENMVLSTLPQIASRGVLQKRRERQQVTQAIESFSIKVHSMENLITSLSGGNQQKVIFSKWLRNNPRILVLHEPTRGVDIQSKVEIYQLLRKLANEGVGILMISSDMMELIGMSDRIYVMYEGRITGHLNGETATEEQVMSLATTAAKGVEM